MHLASGSQPILRIRGELERVKYKSFDSEELKKLLYEIAPEEKIKVFEETGDVDFAYEIPGLARYRANFFNQKWGIGAVFREIPSEILSVDQLGLPKVVKKLATLPKGLVLVDRSHRQRQVHHPGRHSGRIQQSAQRPHSDHRGSHRVRA